MTRNEFNLWLEELRKRMPDTYSWLQSKDVAGFWYEDMFQDLDKDVCVSALADIWRDGGIPAYERERLPAMIMKRHGEIQHLRKESKQRAAQRRRDAQAKGTFYGDPVMRQALSEARDVLKKEGGYSLTAFCDQYFEGREYPTAEQWLDRPRQNDWSEG